MRKSLGLAAVAAVLMIAGIATLRLMPPSSIPEPKADYFAVPKFDDLAVKSVPTQPSFAWLDMIRMPDASQSAVGPSYDQTHYPWAERAFATGPSSDDMDGISVDNGRPAKSRAAFSVSSTSVPSPSGTTDFGASLSATFNQISTQATAKASAGIGATSAAVSDTGSAGNVPFRLFVTNESAVTGLSGAVGSSTGSVPATVVNTATAVTSAVPLKK